jgi:superfamily I DNA and/or RNA helicase
VAGVITLYKSQLQVIQSRIDLARSKQETDKHAVQEWKRLQVLTVDAFQGGEREVIILSCVRTEHIGFIDSDR